MSDYELYTNQIKEIIAKVEISLKGKTEQNFLENEELKDATLMRLQVLGELVKKLPLEIKKKDKEVRWKKFENLRNIISHRYTSIEYELIWSFLGKNLKELKQAVLKIK